MSVSEAARRWGVARSTARAWLKQGRLPPVKHSSNQIKISDNFSGVVEKMHRAKPDKKLILSLAGHRALWTPSSGQLITGIEFDYENETREKVARIIIHTKVSRGRPVKSIAGA